MNSDHRRARELLPWYVAGTLEGEELDLVRSHVHTCPSCAREHRALVELCGALKASLTALPGPPPEVLHRTWIRVLRAEQQRARRSLRGKVAGAVAGLVAAAAVAAFGGAFRAVPFSTLAAGRADSRPVLQVVFNPRAAEADIRSLLHRVGATIVEGPGGSGVYRLRLEGGADPADAVRRLRASELVLFAEVEP
ncbi:MAG: anti-sigma factor family protein [bacterium]